jgi:hypothetical protein
MKTTQTILLTGLIMIGLACGYSKPATTPAQAGTMPAISSLSPSSQNAGSPAFLLTVDGANFSNTAAINFGTAQVTTTPVSSTRVKAMIPASAIVNAGTVAVTVTNPGTAGGIYGGGTLPATSAAMNFTVM